MPRLVIHNLRWITALAIIALGTRIDMVGNRSYGNRSYGNRSYGNRSYGNRPYGMPNNLNSIRVKDRYLYYDSLKLSLDKIPKVQELHTISKRVLGPWYRLYTAIKIEESGNDGQNSYYARAYNNLVGMRYPKKRKTTALRMGNDYYAVYANWYEGMLDFRYYIDYMEGSFERKFKRKPQSEKEFINHIFGSYNIYSKWKKDVFWILDRHPVLKDTL